MIALPRARAVFLLMLVGLFGAGRLVGQRFLFRQYGSTDGLSNLSVNCLLQDRTGYIWAGTDNGLFRYDGTSFRLYSHAEGLPSTEIRTLAATPDGELWVATQNGIAVQVGNQFKVVETGESGRVEAMSFNDIGEMYLLRISGVVRGRRDPTGAYQFQTVAPGRVGGLAVHGKDVWFTRDGDLWDLREGREQKVGSGAGLPNDQWGALVRDSLGNLWVRSSQHLYELPRGQNRVVDRSAGIPHASNMKLYADPWGRVFVSSDSGIVSLYGTLRTYIDSNHGLPSDGAGPVLKDREESLWVGLLGGGLVRRLGHGEWLSWKKEDGLPHNGVWSVLHDLNGRLWVGTNGGMTIYGPDGKVERTWSSKNGLLGDTVRSILGTRGGEVFVGTFPGGVSRFSKDGLLEKNYAIKADYSQQVVAMAMDHDGRLWGVGGAGCFRSKEPIDKTLKMELEPVEIPEITARATFRDILVGDGGVIWISSSEGLLRFDGTGWRVFTEADGLKSRDLSAIADGQSLMYVTYRDALGISKLKLYGDQVQVSHITKREGLSSDLVYALALDGTGRLWVSTDDGVNVLEEGHWRHYGTEDGLIWDDGDDLALSIDRDNRVWIGTSGGLSRFAPLPYAVTQVTPTAVLSAIQVGAQEFQPTDQPEMPHGQSALYVRFSALDFSTETHVRFRYRLLGYETAWHETRERSIRFADLPAGHYVFEVVAIDPKGVTSATPARFSFAIERAWWQSWWFMMGCVVTFVGLARAIWSFRMRVVLARTMALEQEVAERTAELRESHRQLEELAYCDMLTSLPNRRMFTEQFKTRLAMARRHGDTFALLLIDLDHFKGINDTHGHDAGDAVLVETARRLNGVVRETDCLARLGGDEFALLMVTKDDKAGIATFCGRICESFESGIEFQGQMLKLSCSVGIALALDQGDTQEMLYKAADLALYEAKRQGRNTYSFYRPAEAVAPGVGREETAASGVVRG